VGRGDSVSCLRMGETRYDFEEGNGKVIRRMKRLGGVGRGARPAHQDRGLGSDSPV